MQSISVLSSQKEHCGIKLRNSVTPSIPQHFCRGSVAFVSMQGSD
ncbi:unnamed protein product [Amoebophrya sp. A25]|nr:unnamed protein product [Amoebophrya sp. A25]|eukprot:GSA25T00004702001.1